MRGTVYFHHCVARAYFSPVEYLLPLLKGLGTGVVLSFMLGTVFFALIQSSMRYGYKTGIFMACGVIASDLIFISLALLGVSFVPRQGVHGFFIELGAAIILVIMGLMMLKDRREAKPTLQLAVGDFFYYFSKGFLLNIVNPVNFMFWLGLASVARTGMEYTIHQLIVYFGACLMGIFGAEVGISIMANRLSSMLSEKTLSYISRGVGLVFLLIALRIAYDVVILFPQVFG